MKTYDQMKDVQDAIQFMKCQTQLKNIRTQPDGTQGLCLYADIQLVSGYNLTITTTIPWTVVETMAEFVRNNRIKIEKRVKKFFELEED